MGFSHSRASGKYPVVNGIELIPDAMNPSGFREYCVTDRSWNDRRLRCSLKATSRCTSCHCRSEYPNGDADHIKSTGAGGDDSLENLRWLCRTCHFTRHSLRNWVSSIDVKRIRSGIRAVMLGDVKERSSYGRAEQSTDTEDMAGCRDPGSEERPTDAHVLRDGDS